MATTVTLKDVHDAVRSLRDEMVRREDLEAVLDMPLLLAHPDTRRQLARSRRDKEAGRTLRVRSVRALLE